jgi:hypothetical protein
MSGRLFCDQEEFVSTTADPVFDEEATRRVREWAEQTLATAATPEAGAREIVRSLGAHPEEGGARFGFWTPELTEEAIPPGEVHLELLLPVGGGVDLSREEQTLRFRRFLIPTERSGEYTWCVVRNVPAGARDALGAFYRLVFRDPSGEVRHIGDPLAASVPFGAGAPAELYDIPALLAGRRDGGYFLKLPVLPDPDGVDRVTAPVSLLEIHVPTATAAGTIAGLTGEYRRIAARLTAGASPEDLSASDRALLGYEAIQLMPIEPTILFEEGEPFWREERGVPARPDGSAAAAASRPEAGALSGGSSATSSPSAGAPAPDGETIAVAVRRPYSTNWGYDVITAASPAVNPVLLETGRPEEFLELIETLHTFPAGPIRIVLDVVYGHADNQTLALLNSHFFAGANMYGQNLNYRHPVVRAILLEMQRRKSDFGIDGVRVDGAQDFTYWVREEDRLYHDDEYLALMNDVEQVVAGRRYRPWMIFEDGRPWPRDDWELASSYREVTRKLPRVVQWGPLTFAHNTPFLFTFWISKWWRIRELLEVGANWITGNSNHDTLRRGTQVSPEALVNTYLGSTLPEVFENGYDNPASRLFDAFVPGIPMDFLNANLRGPWSFVRNTDHRWAIKVVSEEARFLDWGVTPERFNHSWAFPRLKARGFHSLTGLKRFQAALVGAVQSTEYRPDALAAILNAVHPDLEGPPHWDGDTLQQVAREWMDDVHEFCCLDHYRDRIDRTEGLRRGAVFGWQVRLFRRREGWLAGNLREGDSVTYDHPTEGTVLLRGHRWRPETVASADGPRPIGEVAPASEYRELVLLANLEGAPRRIVPAEWIGNDGSRVDDARLVLATPALGDAGRDPSVPLELANGQAVLYGIR